MWSLTGSVFELHAPLALRLTAVLIFATGAIETSHYAGGRAARGMMVAVSESPRINT